MDLKLDLKNLEKMEQNSFKMVKNLDRAVNEGKLLAKADMEWIWRNTNEGKYLVDWFGENKVKQAAEKAMIKLSDVFKIEYLQYNEDMEWCLLLERNVAGAKTRDPQDRRKKIYMMVDAVAIPSPYKDVALNKVYKNLFFSLDERLSGMIFKKKILVKKSKIYQKVSELIKERPQIAEMELTEVYHYFFGIFEEVEVEESKFSLYCNNDRAWIIYLSSNEGTIHLDLEALLKKDKERLLDTMKHYLYQLAYEEETDKEAWLERQKATPEFKMIEEIFFT